MNLTKEIIMTVTHDKVVPSLKTRHRRAGDYYYFYGNKRWIKIGNAKNIRLKDARNIARDYAAKIAAGINPVEGNTQPQKFIQVINNWQQYNKDSLKPKTYDNYCNLIDRYIQPALGNRDISSITFVDCVRLHKGIKAKVQANRVIQLLSKLLNVAVDEGFITTNPATRVKLNKEKKREAYLEPDRVQAILDRCVKSKDKRDVYILTLMLTAARESEIRTAKWSDIDWEDSALLVDGKTGERDIYLPAQVVDAFKRISNNRSKYVFPDRSLQKPMAYPQSFWYRFRAEVGISNDFRLHDFRHNYASMALSNGASLDQIGEMLGHSNSQTTKRYSHLVAAKKREIGDNITGHITQSK